MTQANTVLVVDDEASLVELCRIILENAGYEVRGAVSGREALKSMQEDMPDVVLLDVMMQGMDGIQVCREIRTLYNPDTPFILMYTADSRKETLESSLEAGANDLITKEIPIFELPAKINAYLH
jgi:CheY-like chemotaxis protein